MWIETIEDAAPSEDMALKDGDLEQIDARVSAASALLHDRVDKIAADVTLLRPHGWRWAVHLLREIGPLAAIIAIIVALLAITLGALYQSFSHVKEEAEFRTNTKNQLENFGTQLYGLRTLISANQPQRPQNQTAAKLALAEARQQSIKIPVDVVQQAGGRFIEAAAEAPQSQAAWGVALEFVSYRSFLNAPNPPKGHPRSSADVSSTSYFPPDVPGKPTPRLFIGQIGADPKEFARWEPIGKDANIGKTNQPLQLFADGGASSLDGAYIRNVIFTGSEIHYSGAPVILDNVVFIDCTFVFDNNDRGRKLSQVILASASITFQELG